MIRSSIATVFVVCSLASGCASTPSEEATTASIAPQAAGATSTAAVDDTAQVADAPNADATNAEATKAGEPKVVQTTAQAEKYVSEEEAKRAYRACMRKMRRITGSRIPRNACQGSAGLHPNAWNQRQEGSGQVSSGLPGD